MAVMTFRTVLCPVDFTELTGNTLQVAAKICQLIDARLVLHHNQVAVPPDFLSVHWMWSEEHEDGEQRKEVDVIAGLEKLFETLPPGLDYEAKISRGPLEKGLLYLAKELPADLIVMASHGWSTPEHRSVTEQVVLNAPCTVLTTGEECEPETLFAPHPGKKPFSLPVLIAVDRLDKRHAALDFALSLAEKMPHELDLLHVVKPMRPGADKARHLEQVARAREQLESLVPELLSGRVRAHVTEGPPGEAILRLAQEIEPLFILMGARKKRLLPRKLADRTSLTILHGAKCPVWFVPDSRSRRTRKRAS